MFQGRLSSKPSEYSQVTELFKPLRILLAHFRIKLNPSSGQNIALRNGLFLVKEMHASFKRNDSSHVCYKQFPVNLNGLYFTEDRNYDGTFRKEAEFSKHFM